MNYKNVFFMENQVFSLGLSVYEIAVYAYLCRCRNQKRNNTCYPSVKTVARNVSISETKARLSLHSLKDRGLISVESAYEKKRQRNNLYTVHRISPISPQGCAENEWGLCEKAQEGACGAGEINERIEYNVL